VPSAYLNLSQREEVSEVTVQWKYNLEIMVNEASKVEFHNQLITYLTNAKTAGKIVSAKGSCQPTEVPEEIVIT
jgi:hypothetical protein